MHLFSLCIFSLLLVFTFVSSLLFLFNSLWFSLVFFPVFLIFSTALPFSLLTFYSRVLLKHCFQLGLFCLVYCSFPLPCVLQQPPFLFLFLFFPLADQKPGSFYFFTTVGFSHLGIFLSPGSRADGCFKESALQL